jgi:4-oxalocrotonate tautomerase
MKGFSMPYVNIKITKEGATPDQKARLIKGVTDLLVDVLGKNPHTTVVVIDEVETDNWGIGGETVTALRSLAEPPKERPLPESLIRYREERKRAEAGDLSEEEKPSKKGKKRKPEE